MDQIFENSVIKRVRTIEVKLRPVLFAGVAMHSPVPQRQAAGHANQRLDGANGLKTVSANMVDAIVRKVFLASRAMPGKEQVENGQAVRANGGILKCR